MKMALDGAVGVNTIKAYEPGRVQIRDRYFSTSLIVLRDQLLADWQARSAVGLRAADLEPVLDKRPEVLILGTGETQVFPDPAAFMTLMDLRHRFRGDGQCSGLPHLQRACGRGSSGGPGIDPARQRRLNGSSPPARPLTHRALLCKDYR